MRRRLLALSVFVALAAPAFAQAPPVPLIERAKLFGNPSKVAGRVSPNGEWLAWIAPRDGVLNIWMAPVANPGAAKALTAETKRPIRQYFWSPDSKTILFLNDSGGDENFLLYGVDIATGAQKTITPFEKTRALVVGISRVVKDRILVGLNNRDARWHDVHSLDLATGKLTLVLQNDGGYAGFTADEHSSLVSRRSRPLMAAPSSSEIVNGKVEDSAFATVGLEDSQTTGPLGFSTDGKTLYWLDSRGRDTAALVAQDVASGRQATIAEDPRADIGKTLSDPKTGVVQAWSVDYLRTEWQSSDPAIGRELAWLESQLKGDVNVTSRTDADDKWTVTVDPVIEPASTWLYDRPAKKLTKLFIGRPELVGAAARCACIRSRLKARDGLARVSYLTLPAGSDPDGDGKPTQPVPLVLSSTAVPGRATAGASARCTSGSPTAATRCCGSTSAARPASARSSSTPATASGAGKMHDDLLDAVDWAVDAEDRRRRTRSRSWAAATAATPRWPA